MDRTELLDLWNRHHTDSTWITPWSKAVGGLTAAHLLTHDAYHPGQIMQLRAMQGLPPIE